MTDLTELEDEESEVVAVGEKVESQLASRDEPVEGGEHGGEVEKYYERREVHGQYY